MSDSARAVIAKEARPLLRALRQRMPADFIEGPSEKITLTRTETGRIALGIRDVWFFFADNGELTAGRRDENGEAEFGGIDGDGTIRWGWAVVHHESLN